MSLRYAKPTPLVNTEHYKLKVAIANKRVWPLRAARYGAVLAAEYGQTKGTTVVMATRAFGTRRHLPNIKWIGQQAAKLWGFFCKQRN